MALLDLQGMELLVDAGGPQAHSGASKGCGVTISGSRSGLSLLLC